MFHEAAHGPQERQREPRRPTQQYGHTPRPEPVTSLSLARRSLPQWLARRPLLRSRKTADAQLMGDRAAGRRL
eukprot:4810171-Prymnesium_polylepis.2